MTALDQTPPSGTAGPLTLPADLPPPPVPGFAHERLTLPFDGPVHPGPVPALLTAVAAVLARHTAAAEVVLGTLDPGSGRPAAVRARVAADTTLGELAAALETAQATPVPWNDRVRVVCLAGDERGRAAAARLVDRDLVLSPGLEGGLECAYDPERYLPDSVRELLELVRTVLELLSTEPGLTLSTLDSRLGVTGRPAPAAPAPSAEPVTDAPRNRTERLIAGLWGEALELSDLGREENFFALGGHSLLAVQVTMRMRELFDLDLPVDQVFATPTVRAAAERVRDQRAQRRCAPVPPPRPAPPGTPALLSASQERIWFFENWSPGTAAYNQPWALHLRGRLDPVALAAAINDVVARHEILRATVAVTDGRPELAYREALTVPLTRHEPGGRDGAAEALLTELAARPFDLGSGPLLRADLLRLGTEEHVLLLTLHHLVSDGWSLSIVLGDLADCYRARVSGGTHHAPPPRLRYADLAAWQRSALRGEATEEAVRYFAGELEGAPALLQLPADRPRPAVPSYAGATVEFALPEELGSAVRGLARECGTTPFVVLLAGFGALLHRYSGQQDVVVGTTCANRDRPEAEEVAGPLFNQLALRARFAGDPEFAALVEQLRLRALGAFARQEVPFDHLVDRLVPQREPSHSPLFQVLLELAGPPEGAAPDGLSWSSRLIGTGTSKLDLTLTFTDTGSRLDGLATYSTDLFDEGTVRRLLAALEVLLAGACAEPGSPVSALPVLAAPDRELLARVNDTELVSAGRPGTVHGWFERQAAATPQAVAVRTSDRRLSYAELNAEANRLAWRLRELGAGPEVRIALCLDRSEWMLIAMLGVLKAGAAYVPVDPGYPAERKRLLAAGTMLLACAGPVDTGWYPGPLVQLEEDRSALPAGNPPALATPDNLAYVIYTSGSTGAPKGVLVQHDGLVNYLDWCLRGYVGTATGGAPVFSSYAFDMLVPDIYAPLLCGQPVHLLPAEAGPAELGDLLAEGAPYAFIKLTPGHLDLLAEQLDPARASALCATLVVGADSFHRSSLDSWRRLDPATIVLNEYGPTEASVANSVLHTSGVTDGELLPIGRPIQNTTMHVLDGNLRPVPAGVPGELYIGGDCVVRGYHGRGGLTAERFLPDPFSARPGARMYRTGDAGRLLPDGNFEFLGRLDDQLKIGGFRVEPGEVEAALGRHPAVRQAVVLGVPARTGGHRLAAYLVAEPGGTLDRAALREYLAERLPPHLVPDHLLEIPAIPLNANGKVDRSALPDPEARQPDEAAHGEAAEPVTAVQRVLRTLWAQVLERPEREIDLRSDFFGLGGRSLDVVRLLSRVRDTLRVRVPAVGLFRTPTIAALAEAVTAAAEPGASERIATAVLRVRELTPQQRAELLRRHGAARTN